LTVFRVTHLLVVDDGPFGVFCMLREAAGVFDENGTIVVTKEWLWSGLLSCHWCLSVWIALPMALLWRGLSLTVFPAWMALAGASALLEEAARRLRE
jgi:hypothetical protein